MYLDPPSYSRVSAQTRIAAAGYRGRSYRETMLGDVVSRGNCRLSALVAALIIVVLAFELGLVTPTPSAIQRRALNLGWSNAPIISTTNAAIYSITCGLLISLAPPAWCCPAFVSGDYTAVAGGAACACIWLCYDWIHIGVNRVRRCFDS